MVASTSTENWTATKSKAFAKAIQSGASIHEIGLDLGMDPLVLLQILCLDGVVDGSAFSEEQAQFFSLSLDGIPVLEAICWCQAEPGRLTQAEIEAARMGLALDEGFDLARRHRITLPNSLCLDDLCALCNHSDVAVSTAVNALLDRFEVPTPGAVHAEILRPSVEAPVTNLNPSTSNAKGVKGAKRSYKKSSRRSPPTTTTYTLRRHSSRRRRAYV